ncbi:MAG TPA: helix-turn-helix domain-containing protein [Candidatus Gracilibacteria bacterium]
MSAIIPLLRDCGLTDKEALIYLELLSTGSTYASIIAGRLGMSRNLVRYLCQQLVKKGMCIETKKKNAFIYTPEPPEKFMYELDQEEKKIRNRKKAMGHVLGELKSMMDPKERLPQISFLAGQDGFQQLCEVSLQCKSREILFVTNITRFRDVLTTEYDTEHYIPTRLRRGVHFKMLTTRTAVGESMHKKDHEELRETRFIPKDFEVDNTFYIFDDSVAFMSTEKELNCTMIQSAEITAMMRQVFAFMWESAERD